MRSPDAYRQALLSPPSVQKVDLCRDVAGVI